jgi:integrase
LNSDVETLRRLDRDHTPNAKDRFFSTEIRTATGDGQTVSVKLIGDCFDEYVKEKRNEGRTPKSMAKYHHTQSLIKDAFGLSTPIAKVSRDDCKRLRDALRTYPANASKYPKLKGKTVFEAADIAAQLGMNAIAIPTANSQLQKLSTFFRWACREQYIASNPAEGLSVGVDPVRAEEKRLPFSVADLTSMFNAPLYTGCRNDEHGYAHPGNAVIRRHRFWVPLVGLWTGMRLGEICQLKVADIRRIDDVWTIAVATDSALDLRSDKDVEKHVVSRKSKAARRNIPIHEELIRIGFLEYVDARREANDAMLFPAIKPDCQGYLSGPFSKWFRNFLLKVGAKTPRTNFHSFRHTYRDAMRRAGVSRDVVLSIGGWAEPTTTADHYGGVLPISRVKEELGRISFEGLDLSHLYVQRG